MDEGRGVADLKGRSAEGRAIKKSQRRRQAFGHNGREPVSNRRKMPFCEREKGRMRELVKTLLASQSQTESDDKLNRIVQGDKRGTGTGRRENIGRVASRGRLT